MPPWSLQLAFRLALLLSVAVSGACGSPPTARTLEGAFERVAAAIDAGDAKRLYWDLELEARWSLMSIHRNQKQIRSLVDRDYPREERARAEGHWKVGADAKDPGELFAVLCARRDCLAPLRAKIGAVERIERTATGGVVHTIPGGEYRFLKGKDGRFGLVGFGDELAALSREVSRDMRVILRTAEHYRRARGDADAPPPDVALGEKGR